MSFAKGSVRGPVSDRTFGFAAGGGLSNASLTQLPLPVALLLLSMLLPGELDFHIGGLRLNCQRLVILAFLPVAIIRIFTRRGPALRTFDLLFIGAVTYYSFTYFLKVPLERALQSGGIMFLESIGGYMLARSYIRNAAQFFAVVKLLFLMVLVVGAFAIPETFLSSYFVRNGAAAMTGAAPLWPGETRLGFMRAMSVFDHPIHYGVFCTTVFGLAWFSEPDPVKRIWRALIIGGMACLSLSAGPLQGIVFVLAGALWEAVTRNIPNRVWLTVTIGSLLYLVMSLITKRSPLEILVTSLVFDPGSYWYRRMIWDHGVTNIQNNPWIGVPFGTWERGADMNTSVDNYWLALALWGGIPSVALLALSVLLILRATHGRFVRIQSADDRRCRFAWVATVLSMCVIGASVHYWGTLSVLFAFCLGSGAWLSEPPRLATQVKSPSMGRLRGVRHFHP
jgi:hypothetical protein